MKKVIPLLFVLALLFSTAVSAGEDEAEAVRKAIIDGYVKAVHIERDVPAMEKGFHPDFVMFIKKEGEIRHFTLPAWIESVGKRKGDPPPGYKVTWDIPLVDIEGDAAVARVEIYRDGKHIYTDYMSLYKFDDGWQIVGKIYHSHK